MKTLKQMLKLSEKTENRQNRPRFLQAETDDRIAENQAVTTARNHSSSAGTSRALTIYMRETWRRVIFAALMVGAVSPNAIAGSPGSDGGTNVNRETMNPVEFETSAKRVPINPRTFEGLYAEFKPMIDTIEQKIPGLGKKLEVVFDKRDWFVTDETFEARNANELKPINQTPTKVLLTEAIKNMSREQLKKAFVHEMVRRVIQDDHSVGHFYYPGGAVLPFNLSQSNIDQIVEQLTVVLYRHYDLPARSLARLVNDVVINTTSEKRDAEGYISLPEVYERIRELSLSERYNKICKDLPYEHLNGTKTKWGFKEPTPSLVRKEKQRILAVLNQLQTKAGLVTDGSPGVFHANHFAIKTDTYPANNFRPLRDLRQFEILTADAIHPDQHYYTYPGKEPFTDNQRVSFALLACSWLTREDVTLIERAAESNGDEDGFRGGVYSIDQALEALRQLHNNRAATSDTAEDTRHVKSAPTNGGPVNSGRAVDRGSGVQRI